MVQASSESINDEFHDVVDSPQEILGSDSVPSDWEDIGTPALGLDQCTGLELDNLSSLDNSDGDPSRKDDVPSNGRQCIIQ